MNILLTNDDGIDANGIKILENILKDYGNVYVSAPMKAKSGAGCSLTINNYVEYKEIDDRHIALDANPVDCVIFGFSYYQDFKFDVVVSGCNNGYNLSFDSMYSGTIGACFQALVMKTKTIAFSMDRNFYEQDLVTEIKNVMDYVFKHDLLSNKYLLNVNLASKPYVNSKGILITKQYLRNIKYSGEYQDNKVLLKRNIIDETSDVIYDVGACKNGYVSITPLKITRYCNGLYEKIVNKVNEGK